MTLGMKPLLLCGEEQKTLQGQVSVSIPFLSALETLDTVNNAAFIKKGGVRCVGVRRELHGWELYAVALLRKDTCDQDVQFVV